MRAGSAGERESRWTVAQGPGETKGAAAFHVWHRVRMEMKWISLYGI